MLGYECMHWLRHHKGKTGYVALKLDMSKAYDRVEWGYLEKLMERMGFCLSWRALIMRCVRSVSYSFKLNGLVGGRLRPSHGIRQRDPLSPYLFILCTQGLSAIISSFVARGDIR